MSLVDILEQLDAVDEEMTKEAAEQDAAGRIMARGFMDELNKLAQTTTLPATKDLPKRKITHRAQSITTPLPGGGSKTHYPQKKLTITRPKESVGQYARSLK